MAGCKYKEPTMDIMNHKLERLHGSEASDGTLIN